MIPADPAPVASRPAPAVAPGDARAMVEMQLSMLTRLAEIGMELAESCGREAKAPPSDTALTRARTKRHAAFPLHSGRAID